MKVMKFGGTSVGSIESLINLRDIIERCRIENELCNIRSYDVSIIHNLLISIKASIFINRRSGNISSIICYCI